MTTTLYCFILGQPPLVFLCTQQGRILLVYQYACPPAHYCNRNAIIIRCLCFRSPTTTGWLSSGLFFRFDGDTNECCLLSVGRESYQLLLINMFGGGGGVVYIAVIIIIIIIVHPQTHLESTCRKSFHYLFSDHYSMYMMWAKERLRIELSRQ